MSNKTINCGKLNISNDKTFTLIAGPCQLENEKHAIDIAKKLKDITTKLNIGLIYKTSFDKANRTSLKGKRGAGLEYSLPVFETIFSINIQLCLSQSRVNLWFSSYLIGHTPLSLILFSRYCLTSSSIQPDERSASLICFGNLLLAIKR